MVVATNDAPRRLGRGFQPIVHNASKVPAFCTPAKGKLRPLRRIDFAALNRAALPYLPELCGRWLTGGYLRGREYIARNPKRSDAHAGSFSINTSNGKWADFADSRARGNDVVSLAGYLFDLTPGQAARRLAQALGIEVPHV